MRDAKKRLDVSKSLSRDEALLELYRLLQARNAPSPDSFTGLSSELRREYFRLARRRSRARVRASAAAGAIEPTTGNIRDALADAALMILATNSPGVDQVRIVLAAVFAKRPGVPLTVEQRTRSGKLRPKLLPMQGSRP